MEQKWSRVSDGDHGDRPEVLGLPGADVNSTCPVHQLVRASILRRSREAVPSRRGARDSVVYRRQQRVQIADRHGVQRLDCAARKGTRRRPRGWQSRNKSPRNSYRHGGRPGLPPQRDVIVSYCLSRCLVPPGLATSQRCGDRRSHGSQCRTEESRAGPRSWRKASSRREQHCPASGPAPLLSCTFGSIEPRPVRIASVQRHGAYCCSEDWRFFSGECWLAADHG
jgi:hypothetical protein